MMIISGIDASMKCTAVTRAVLDDNFDIVELKMMAYHPTAKRCFQEDLVDVRFTGPGYAGKYIYEREDIALEMLDSFMDGVTHTGIEDFSFGSKDKSSSLFQLAEFIGVLRRHIFQSGIEIFRYSPTSVKAYASESTNADKIIMTRALINRYEQYCPKWFPEFVSTYTDASPVGDMVDSFWMMDVLRNTMKLKAGLPVPPWAKLRLTSKASKDSIPLCEIVPEVRKK